MVLKVWFGKTPLPGHKSLLQIFVAKFLSMKDDAYTLVYSLIIIVTEAVYH